MTLASTLPRVLLGAIALAAATAPIGRPNALANAPGQAAALAPHRAVYDITLAGSKAGSGVGEVMGRMVYELTGNACEGWTQNMRFVTRMAGTEGNAVLSDMRSSSWEDAKGERFRFNSTHTRDQKDPEATVGDASRPAGKSATVELTRPEKKQLTLAPAVQFPMQHTLAMLDAARRDQRIYVAELYDGSEKGEKIYATTAVIGQRKAPGVNATLPVARNAERLDKLAAWPVSISYFEKGKAKDDAVPDYELAFLAFENGVSRKLFIDYGDFAIRGTLSEINFTEPARCDPQR